MYACITHTWVHCICKFQVIVSQIEHGWHFNTHEHIMWWSLPFCRTTMTLTIQDEKSTVGPIQFFCLLLWVSLTPRYSLYFQWLCLQMHSCTLKVSTHSKESIDLKGLKHCIFLPFFPLIACCLHFTRSISQNNSMSHLSLSSVSFCEAYMRPPRLLKLSHLSSLSTRHVRVVTNHQTNIKTANESETSRFSFFC